MKLHLIRGTEETQRNMQGRASNYIWVPDRVPELGTVEYERIAGSLTYERMLAAHANGIGHS